MFEWKSWLGLGTAIVIAIAVALVVIIIVALITRGAARRRAGAQLVLSKARHPFRFLVLVIATWIAVALTLPDENWLGLTSAHWHRDVNHGFLILTIVSATWLIAALLGYGLSIAVGRYQTSVPDNRAARRAQTQLLIVRRLLVVIIVIVGLASVLLTFPGVQALGTSVLASAGVVSIVAGLAAQSTLGNVFAGIQLAFSDAIRVDDVVVVNAEWGRIEEITLTYVVVHVWDDRRLVVPSTYFTGNPFENWTRTSSQLLGEVDFDLDWRVSTAAMREHLGEILKDTQSWDGRTQVLQVTDAVGGFVHVRILVSAKDSPTLFDLRCFVREAMVDWVQHHNPQTMPRTRITLGDAEIGEQAPPKPRGKQAPKTDQIGLFTGADGEKRASEFTAPTPIVRDTPTGN
ncbi:MAG TPA: mechanosensitive ion channel domain-containing protein [Galbitalea sp.]|jgi:small-conductance mechanosensitive channel|nr:mechanosensitive ion channel domain-containing protein [Galbitalea sp.]